MQKDFKIGLGVGLLFVIGTALWLSTRPDLGAEARALQAASFSRSSPVSRDLKTEDPPSLKLRRAGEEQATGYDASPTLENEPIPEKFHIVQKGETLSGISAKYYGSPRYWQRILTANRATLNDPNRLIPGSRLVIPK